ncbi:MAG: glycosyltransferase family 39 protein, partial [Candidatus Parabeggiatoa sp.]|nr:glycosyltransferase family 39 protein [Candidatus Parabeggiatoa sp.]
MLKIERFLQPKFLLTAMILLQTLWLILGWTLAYLYDYVPSLQNPYKMSFIIAFTLVVGLMIISLPTQVLSRMRQIKEHLLKNQMHLLLVLGAIVLIVAGIYINNLRWGSDEEAFFNAAMIMVENVEFFEGYAQTWMARQHPPLPHIVTGFFMQIFGDDLFIMRFVVSLIGIATVLLIYFMGCELYDRYTGFLAALCLLSFPRFLQHSTVVAGNDIFITFFFTLAVFLFIRLRRNPSYWLSIKTGVVIGMGLLSKYTMILIYPMLLSLLFFKKYQFKNLIFHLGIISLISMSILGIWLVVANEMGLLDMQSERMVFHAGLEQ